MSNIVYTKFIEGVMNGTYDLDSGSLVLRAMLERSTSTYSPNVDHDFVGTDMSGFVELTASGYSRQTLGSKTVAADDANNRVELDCADLSFGSIVAGQTVKAIVIYVQTGGDDATPNDDVLAMYIDTATGLPATPAGGAFQVVIDVEGILQGRSA